MNEPADLFRLYEPSECGDDGYPYAWHHETQAPPERQTGLPQDGPQLDLPVKDLVRENHGHRCLRCCHPFVVGSTPGSWSPCDELCSHFGAIRYRDAALADDWPWTHVDLDTVGIPAGEARMDEGPTGPTVRFDVEAAWRVLTVHHLLTGHDAKRNLLWWNLVPLCQRCHLLIQRKVKLATPWPWPHSDWFRPHAAGWYAYAYLGEHLSRAETLERLDELLLLERRADRLFEFGRAE